MSHTKISENENLEEPPKYYMETSDKRAFTFSWKISNKNVEGTNMSQWGDIYLRKTMYWV